ncbi:PAS domain S-box protein [Mesonia aquimarina]|uniref:PAS domain S-box protein n=1 Tax=Mesonia aquimarina TaxID=1504967 RepID=UPI000EF5BFAC|nr:PAS domain S-box protein [Mesonia aquimarina]
MQEERKYLSWFLTRPYLSGFFVFCLVFLLSTIIAYQEYSLVKENVRKEKNSALALVEQNIDQSLKNSYISTFTLALTIDDEGKPKNFAEVSKKILANSTSIDALQLVPDGVIQYVYPFEANKEALGLDILNTPTTKDEALKAIETKQLYFAGPLKLKQGGMGMVGRLPIFIKNKFWGFSAVIIKLDRLIDKSGVNQLSQNGLYFQFSKVNPLSKQEEFFLEEDKNISLKNAEKLTIEEGDWTIYVASTKPNKPFYAALPYLLFGFLLAGICSIFTIIVFKRPAELQKIVKIQTVKLLNSELKFKAIFDQAGVGIVHVNAENGAFIEANKRFCDKVMLSLEELKHKNFYELIEEDSFQKKTLLENSKAEVKLLRNDGMPIFARLTNSPFKSKQGLSYITIVEDITEKKKTRKHLKELKTRMEMAIRVSKLAYWEWDIATDRITWSKRMYEIFNIPEGKPLNSSEVLDYFHKSDVEKYKYFNKQLLIGKSIEPYEVRIEPAPGKVAHILIHVETEEDEDGNVCKLKGSLLDVSKEKQAEKKLNDSYDLVLQQNQRLLNFSYIISHNLRSHAANIKSLLSLLLPSSKDKEQEQLMEMLQSVSDSLDETLFDLNDIVDIQKKTNIVVEPLSVKKYVDRVLKTLGGEIKAKSAKISTIVKENDNINFNAAYFESILLNFISNAIRYSHPERTPEVEIKFEDHGDLKVITIKDNGIGIDLAKNKEKLFGMYKTFTNHPDAKGMGLFISKSQLEALDAKVMVKSKVNKGTTFSLLFK